MALIDKASLLMVPSTYEAGKLYNVLPSGNRAPDSTGENSGYDQTRADFDFDRGSNTAATRVNADGLIEKYRENLVKYSQEYGGSGTANWANVGSAVISTDNTIAPDGTITADKFTTPANTSGVYQVVNVSSGSVYTQSVYLKNDVSTTAMFIGCDLNPSSANITFNPSNGSILTQGGSVIDSSSTDVGDGWYRVSLSFVATGTINTFVIYSSTQIADSFFAWGAQQETGMVATEYLESTSVTGKAGVLIDLPRIDYSSGAGALLLEPSRQNKIQYSEYFGSGYWTKLGASVSFGVQSPQGLKNAFSFVEDSSTGVHVVYQNANITIATGTATLSVFVKENGRNFFQIRTGSAAGITNAPLYANFDLVNNLVTAQSAGANNAIIEQYANGWKRLSISFTITSGSQVALVFQTITSGTSVIGESYTGDGTSGVHIFGAQCEAGSYATSYIPNHGESGGVTRAADSCINGGSAESINSTEGVYYLEISALANDGTFRQTTLSNGTNDDRLTIDWTSTNNQIRCYIETQDVSQGSMTASVSDATDYHKIAVKYKANDFALWVDGTEQSTNTSAAVPNGINQVRFDNSSGSNSFVGNVKQVAVFNEALSDSELATLTTL